MPAKRSSLPAPPAKRARTSAAPAAQPARSGGWGAAQRSRPEIKFNDVAAASYACDTTGTVTLLNGVSTGTDYNNRVGRVADYTAVQIRGSLSPQDLSTSTTVARVMVVWDADPNGGTPSITDFLTASTSLAFNNLNNRERFKVLIDEQHAVGAVTNTATQALSLAPSVVSINRYVRIPKVRTVYSGTGATAANIQNGAIWLVTIGDQAAGSGAIFSGAARVRFTDA